MTPQQVNPPLVSVNRNAIHILELARQQLAINQGDQIAATLDGTLLTIQPTTTPNNWTVGPAGRVPGTRILRAAGWEIADGTEHPEAWITGGVLRVRLERKVDD